MHTTPSTPSHSTSTSTTSPHRPRTDHERPVVRSKRPAGDPDARALVLGGGGSAGNAWTIGVIAGLTDAGLDVTGADLVIGTSAGATAAAQVTSAAPSELLAAVLAPAPRTRQNAPGSDRARVPAGPGVDHLARTGAIIAAASDAAEMRRSMGAAAIALEAASDGSGPPRWRAIVAARLPSQDWPRQALWVVAVDARTGDSVVFGQHSGVDLADAVAASCSSGSAYPIGDGRYIDGGYRRNENADLAAGYGRVLVLSPLGGRTRHPSDWRMQLESQVEELRAGGSRVETILPDAGSLSAFGTNLMDPSTRAPAARAGYDQGRNRAGQLVDLWG
jgi:NTE family protein